MNLLIDDYGLRTLPKKKPVISLDDLYLLLYTHWVLDDATYTDERQRVQVATGILATVFFACRPCSLFDTRDKLDDPHDSEEPSDTIAVVHSTNYGKGSSKVNMDRGHRRKCYKDDIVMPVDSGCDVDNNDYSSTTNDESSSRSNDDDNDSDSDG